MMGNGEYYGHRTMADGSHEPLTKDEAEALWSAVKTAQASRAEAMPTAEDALADGDLALMAVPLGELRRARRAIDEAAK